MHNDKQNVVPVLVDAAALLVWINLPERLLVEGAHIVSAPKVEKCDKHRQPQVEEVKCRADHLVLVDELV